MIKRPFQPLDTFSMSSMTDVIFLLLIFFMVTSTVIFPAAIDVNLPQSGQQADGKPRSEVYIDASRRIWLVTDRNDTSAALSAPREVDAAALEAALAAIHAADSTRAVALYADSAADYGRVVDVLDIGARRNLRMVLSTRARQAPAPSTIQTK